MGVHLDAISVSDVLGKDKSHCQVHYHKFPGNGFFWLSFFVPANSPLQSPQPFLPLSLFCFALSSTIKKKNVYTCLAAPGLNYSTWDLQFSLWHMGPSSLTRD